MSPSCPTRRSPGPLVGSASSCFGIRRRLKMRVQDTPPPVRASDRWGGNGAAAYVFRVSNGNAMGRSAYARVFGGGMNEGAEFAGADGEMTRAGALFTVQGDRKSVV